MNAEYLQTFLVGGVGLLLLQERQTGKMSTKVAVIIARYDQREKR